MIKSYLLLILITPYNKNIKPKILCSISWADGLKLEVSIYKNISYPGEVNFERAVSDFLQQKLHSSIEN